MKTDLVKLGMAALLGLILLPVTVMAQTPEERIDTALDRAEAAGIPVSLLESKIAEGKAKGIPMDRIAAAVDTRLAGLEKARAAMSRGAIDVNAAELSVGADAIGAGVSEAVLGKIAATAGKERRAVAVAALTQLVQQGIAPDSALLRVQDALAHGPQALANLAAQSGFGTSHAPEGAGAGAGGARSGSATRGAGAAGGPPKSVPAPGQGRGRRGGP